MPNNPVLNHHISSQFNEDLQDVNTKFMTMGGLVEQQVANGIHALLDTDASLAIDVQFQDNIVNRLETEIDEALTLIWHVVIRQRLIYVWLLPCRKPIPT